MHFDIILKDRPIDAMVNGFASIRSANGMVNGNAYEGSVTLCAGEFDYVVVGNVLSIYITKPPPLIQIVNYVEVIKSHFA